MASYISSNSNRFYAGIELSYGQAAGVTAAQRFPAQRLQAQQIFEVSHRLDKTGTRTYQGQSVKSRQRTAFEVHSYLSSWSGSGEPGYGPLFHAACGAQPSFSGSVLVSSLVNPDEIVTASPHGLLTGSGISWQNEIRFVTAVLNPYTFTFNAAFSNPPQVGALLGPTLTYFLSTNLPSFTLYDYWDSQNGLSRVVPGCGVDAMDLLVNGDYHEFRFSGPGSDIITSSTLQNGEAGLAGFPTEPTLMPFNGAGVPGHLGQVWLGSSPTQFFTLTEAKLHLKNNLDLRRTEFGFINPTAIVPGQRRVSSNFSLLVQDDQSSIDLYTNAKQRNPFPAMLQLGAQQGQLMGVYLPEMVATVPNYNDTETRLKWDFSNNVAQGRADDELFIAFA